MIWLGMLGRRGTIVGLAVLGLMFLADWGGQNYYERKRDAVLRDACELAGSVREYQAHHDGALPVPGSAAWPTAAAGPVQRDGRAILDRPIAADATFSKTPDANDIGISGDAAYVEIAFGYKRMDIVPVTTGATLLGEHRSWLPIPKTDRGTLGFTPNRSTNSGSADPLCATVN